MLQTRRTEPDFNEFGINAYNNEQKEEVALTTQEVSDANGEVSLRV